MNSNTHKEVKGTPGVTASQTKGNESKTNGQTTAIKDNGMNTTSKTEEKPPVEMPKQKTIEEQMKFFDGLANLVTIKRRFETHRQALVDLAISDEELAKFETEKRFGVRIILHDENNQEYVINNPKLVKDIQVYLISVIESRITEYDHKITAYAYQN